MELLRMVWPWHAGRRLGVDGGHHVEIIAPGEWDGRRFAGARIAIGTEIHNGEIAIGPSDGGRPPILQIATNTSTQHFFAPDNISFVPRVILDIDPVVRMAWQMLREGSASAGCAPHIKALPDVERISILERLQMERLERKCGELRVIHQASESNWNETMYVMLARSMGTNNNKKPFEELAHRVKYSWVSRESGDVEVVEAMLLGASGLLDTCDDTPHTRRLKTHFDHLRNKYSLTAMKPGAWKINDNYAGGQPQARIGQLASFLARGEHLFDNVVACRTVDDIQRLFRDSTSSTPDRRMGSFIANVLGINFVVTMQFAYGKYLGDDKLCAAALSLLEKITCENNSIVNIWRTGGVKLESALDSQAIIQLNNEYCLANRCADCQIGRKIIERVFRGNG
jgi:hypothetical protein